MDVPLFFPCVAKGNGIGLVHVPSSPLRAIAGKLLRDVVSGGSRTGIRSGNLRACVSGGFGFPGSNLSPHTTGYHKGDTSNESDRTNDNTYQSVLHFVHVANISFRFQAHTFRYIL